MLFRSGLRFNCDEVNYVVTEKISAGHYKLEAETLGTVGNKYTGLLLPIQTVNGLDTAQIAAVLIPAEDGDTTDTLREKYYASIDGEAFGGNVADYREKVNAITGVGGVKVYPVWNGGGTVKLTIIASDFTAPSSELISKVQTAIDPEQNHGEGLGLAPIGHTVTVTGARYADIAITTNITFATGWAWSSAQSQVESAVKMYFAELAKVWADSATTVGRAATGRNPEKCWGIASMRWRVMRMLSAASGPTASGVMARFPRPTTSTGPLSGVNSLTCCPTARTARSKNPSPLCQKAVRSRVR